MAACSEADSSRLEVPFEAGPPTPGIVEVTDVARNSVAPSELDECDVVSELVGYSGARPIRLLARRMVSKADSATDQLGQRVAIGRRGRRQIALPESCTEELGVHGHRL